MSSVFCFGMAAVNILLALALPQHPVIAALNWASAEFCFGMGLVTAYAQRR